MKKVLLVLICFLAINDLFAQKNIGRLGVYIKNLYLDESKCMFHAELYYWLKVTYSGDTSQLEKLSNLEFVNSEKIENTIYERIYDYKGRSDRKIMDGKEAYISGYYSGNFRYYPDFRFYPFDKQILFLRVESINLSSDSLVLVPDTAAFSDRIKQQIGIDSTIDIPGFSRPVPSCNTDQAVYNTNFGDENGDTKMAYSRVVYQLEIQRNSLGYIIKILIPNILILIMAYLVFFVPAKDLEVAVGLTVTSLLASIALQLSISNGLPNVGYMITSDKIFYLFYFLITTAMVQTVWSYNLQKSKQYKMAARLDNLGRIIYPAIFLFCIMFICNEQKIFSFFNKNDQEQVGFLRQNAGQFR